MPSSGWYIMAVFGTILYYKLIIKWWNKVSWLDKECNDGATTTATPEVTPNCTDGDGHHQLCLVTPIHLQYYNLVIGMLLPTHELYSCIATRHHRGHHWEAMIDWVQSFDTLFFQFKIHGGANRIIQMFISNFQQIIYYGSLDRT